MFSLLSDAITVPDNSLVVIVMPLLTYTFFDTPERNINRKSNYMQVAKEQIGL